MTTEASSLQEFLGDFRSTVVNAAERLRAISPEESARKSSPDKWSIKEVLGHLIDSAANNHQRFVRARWQDDLMFNGYEQDGWVTAQDYQSAPWQELLDLWAAYNYHLARVMRGTPEAVRLRLHHRHNLDKLAFRPVPADQPASLDYFMRDYVGHLQLHMRQIDAVLG
jgi:hypothetical protein